MSKCCTCSYGAEWLLNYFPLSRVPASLLGESDLLYGT